ncbi:hypothetical protein Dacet_1841 [Denitrovibrio acetiphilus DSM 12809]|uniref:Uncharacterized protein n=1 Tax=Denitrovibrio acetiphilus (strain DSM 12809 / NBRC 114555 / N2460) TaxID=522772 RepID=D4H0U2_DENA2|nr:hypothetical protein [Denitrovibrio acetiphilus]ADD68605.1 hypothetical protein Dacet_1841 [Denitrovibrio acetiphilus DSM 12809]
MAEYIFLNPSINMLKIAETVRSFGRNVVLVRNDQFPEIDAVNVHMFYDDRYRSIFPGDDVNGDVKAFSRMKKNFLSKLTISKIKSELASYSEDMRAGDIVDLCLIKRGVLSRKEVVTNAVSNATSFSKIAADNEHATIVTGYMEFLGGNERLVMYDTDFDLKDALGRDYYIFFINGERVEMCSSGNRLITIGSKTHDHIDILSVKLPFMKRFNFKKIKELVISRNRMPWVVNNIDKHLILVNDFSFFNISVKMTDQWVEKVGRYICTDKQR